MAVIITKYVEGQKMEYEVVAYMGEVELFHLVLLFNRTTEKYVSMNYRKYNFVKMPNGELTKEPAKDMPWMANLIFKKWVDEDEFFYRVARNQDYKSLLNQKGD